MRLGRTSWQREAGPIGYVCARLECIGTRGPGDPDLLENQRAEKPAK